MRAIAVVALVAVLGCRAQAPSIPRSTSDVGALIAAVGGVMIYAGVAGETDEPVTMYAVGVPLLAFGLWLAFRGVFAPKPQPAPPP